MTSPYLKQEAEKLRLVHSAPPPKTGTTRIGALADHDPRDFRFARTQREAGIEHLDWEQRIPVMRPIWIFVIAAGCWGIFGLAITWLISTL